MEVIGESVLLVDAADVFTRLMNGIFPFFDRAVTVGGRRASPDQEI